MSENTISDKAGKAWDKTKEASSDAWDATKETAGDAWDATKEGAQKAGDAISEKSGDAWDATKEASGKAWDKTKEVSSDAWEATKEGAQNVKDKVTGETNDAAYQAHQKTNNAQHENRAGYQLVNQNEEKKPFIDHVKGLAFLSVIFTWVKAQNCGIFTSCSVYPEFITAQKGNNYCIPIVPPVILVTGVPTKLAANSNVIYIERSYRFITGTH